MNEKDLAFCSEELFQERFLRLATKLSKGKTHQEKPVAFLLGGQPGAGKTILHKIIREQLNKNVIVIDNDSFKPFHPNFDQLVKTYGKDYIFHVTPFSNKMTEALIEHLSNHKFNLVIEGTLRTTETPKKTAALLQKKGYEVNLYVMATQKEMSYLNIIGRYEAMYRDDPIRARPTPKEHHDITVQNLPDNLDKLFKGHYFADICIFNREGIKIYSSKETPSTSPKQVLEKVLYGYVPKEMLINRIDEILELAKQNNHELSEIKQWREILLQSEKQLFSMKTVKGLAVKVQDEHKTREKNKEIGIDRI